MTPHSAKFVTSVDLVNDKILLAGWNGGRYVIPVLPSKQHEIESVPLLTGDFIRSFEPDEDKNPGHDPFATPYTLHWCEHSKYVGPDPVFYPRLSKGSSGQKLIAEGSAVASISPVVTLTRAICYPDYVAVFIYDIQTQQEERWETSETRVVAFHHKWRSKLVRYDDVSYSDEIESGSILDHVPSLNPGFHTTEEWDVINPNGDYAVATTVKRYNRAQVGWVTHKAPQPPSAVDIRPQFHSESSFNEWVDIAQADSHKSNLDWGYSVFEAGKQVRELDINGLAFVKDCIELPRFIKNVAADAASWPAALRPLLKELISSKRSLKKVRRIYDQLEPLAKKAADTYLSHHYGTRLSLRDWGDVLDAADNFLNSKDQLYQRLSDKRTAFWPNIRLDRTLTAVVRNLSDLTLHDTETFAESRHQFSKHMRRMAYETDLLPSASNLWDLVPFSFVVDWILPIGNNLEAMEQKGYTSTLPVMVCYLTNKATFTHRWCVDDYNADSIWNEVYYSRRSSATLPPAKVDLEDPFYCQLDGDSYRHIPEATALLITNLVK